MSIYIDADARDRTSTDTTGYKSTITYKPTDIRTIQLVELTDECIEKIVNKIKPVVGGEWIPVTNGRGGFECSECHSYAPSYQSGDDNLSNYCPNCGADMRGGTE